MEGIRINITESEGTFKEQLYNWKNIGGIFNQSGSNIIKVCE